MRGHMAQRSEVEPASQPAVETGASDSRPKQRRRLIRVGIVVGLMATLLVLVAAFGGYILVVNDPLPSHADVVVVMEGSYAANIARFAEGVRQLRHGRADNMLVKVGTIGVWGEWLPDMARRFIGREYSDIADRIIICEGLADSTLEEAKMLQRC